MHLLTLMSNSDGLVVGNSLRSSVRRFSRFIYRAFTSYFFGEGILLVLVGKCCYWVEVTHYCVIDQVAA